MNLKLLPALLLVTAAIGLPAFAQQAAPPAPPPAAPQQESKPPAKKARKVWNDEDVKRLRSPEDAAAEETNTQAEKAPSADPQNAPASQDSPAKPQSAEEADRMIAAKDQEIASREESVNGLRQRFSAGDSGDQVKLQRVIESQTRALAAMRQEREALLNQKNELLQHPPSGGNAAAPAPPPAQ